jgi:hypothetical protein
MQFHLRRQRKSELQEIDAKPGPNCNKSSIGKRPTREQHILPEMEMTRGLGQMSE